uniref:Uncharacterized protein n=1 Tax=Corethron hystrix TaxID=216773 RepID=A0A7S1G217_9STRA|mmetsp:Transcript_738/g.1498  ORF Transcript_738/g.1498 Transcript_738/m.1498 type:complete len:255 (+) Transcript_738:408-1172(+)
MPHVDVGAVKHSSVLVLVVSGLGLASALQKHFEPLGHHDSEILRLDGFSGPHGLSLDDDVPSVVEEMVVLKLQRNGGGFLLTLHELPQEIELGLDDGVDVQKVFSVGDKVEFPHLGDDWHILPFHDGGEVGALLKLEVVGPGDDLHRGHQAGVGIADHAVEEGLHGHVVGLGAVDDQMSGVQDALHVQTKGAGADAAAYLAALDAPSPEVKVVVAVVVAAPLSEEMAPIRSRSTDTANSSAHLFYFVLKLSSKK